MRCALPVGSAPAWTPRERATRRVDSLFPPPYVPAVTTRLAIALNGMRFHTLVGVLPHEREHAQPLEVDVVAYVAPGVRELVDYRVLYDRTASAVGAGPHGFLEDLAASIADETLRVDGVDRVRVAVRKPHVMLPGPLRHAEVVLERGHRG